MHRRDLLRLLAVAGLAGCTTGLEPTDDAEPAPAASASPTSGDPGPLGSTPATTSPSDEPVAAASPSPSADDAAPAEPSRTDEPPTDDEPAEGEEAPAPTETAQEPTERGDEPADEDTQDDGAEEAAGATGDDAAIPRVVTAVGRDALGLPAARGGGRRHQITGLALHHSAAPTGPASGAPDRFRSMTRDHQARGWVDVAYHWGVDVDGNVYELRDERTAGDTSTGYDPAGWLLVVCEGDFEKSAPPRAMLDAAADVFADGARRYGVSPDTLVGHRDLAATLCPGVNLQRELDGLRDQVARRLADGVTLRVGNDEAALAAIEGG